MSVRFEHSVCRESFMTTYIYITYILYILYILYIYWVYQKKLQQNKMTITINELTHSKNILENTVEIEPQPVALDLKNFSQYSSCSK